MASIRFIRFNCRIVLGTVVVLLSAANSQWHTLGRQAHAADPTPVAEIHAPQDGGDPWKITVIFTSDQDIDNLDKTWLISVLANDDAFLPADQIRQLRPTSPGEKRKFYAEVIPTGSVRLQPGKFLVFLEKLSDRAAKLSKRIPLGIESAAPTSFLSGDRAPTASVRGIVDSTGLQRLDLKEWILNRAASWKVKGVAYFDHQPVVTCGRLETIFRELSAQSKQMYEKAGTKDPTSIQQLELSLRNKLDPLYDERYGVRKDWEPFLKEIRAHANRLADEGNIGLDLSNLAHITVVLAQIAEAFQELKKYHEGVEDELSGVFQGGTGQYGVTTQPGPAYGPSDDLRCRRRRCRSCWSLLLGF